MVAPLRRMSVCEGLRKSAPFRVTGPPMLAPTARIRPLTSSSSAKIPPVTVALLRTSASREGLWRFAPFSLNWPPILELIA